MQIGGSASNNLIRLTVPTDINYLASIRQVALDVSRSASLEKDEMLDFSLAVMEAATNAIRHSKSKSLTATFKVNRDNVVARVIDHGCGFKSHLNGNGFPSSEKQGGRGIPLMSNLVDRFKIKSHPGQGTEVTLVKKLERPASSVKLSKNGLSRASSPYIS